MGVQVPLSTLTLKHSKEVKVQVNLVLGKKTKWAVVGVALIALGWLLWTIGNGGGIAGVLGAVAIGVGIILALVILVITIAQDFDGRG